MASDDVSGSTGSSETNPGSTFDASTPAFAQTNPWCVSGDDQLAALRDDPAGLAFDPRRSSLALVGDDASLGLRHDLLRDRDDVVVAHAERSQRLGQHRGKVVALADLREALDGPDLDRHDASSTAVRATAAATSSSRITVSVTATRIPSSSAIRGAASRSRSSITHAESRSRYARAAPSAETFEPGDGHQLVGHAGERRSADDRRDADHRPGPGRDRVADTGYREDRPDRHHRVGRTQQQHVGPRDRVEDPGRGRRSFDAFEPDALHRILGVPLDPVLLEMEVERLARGVEHVDPRRHRVVRHRDHVGRQAEQRRADLGGGLRQGPALVEELRPQHVRRQVAVAEVEPGVDGARGSHRIHRVERLVRAPPAPFAIHQTGEPVADGVEVGRDVQTVDHDVVPGVHDDRGQLARERAVDPAEELPRPDPARERHDLHRGIA